MFDYWYTVGGGKESHTTTQTVVLVPGANHALPDLQMTPENVLTRIAEKFGYQDIDFDENPEFSQRYVLRGENEAAIRSAFSAGTLAYFAAHQGWTVEVRSGAVAVYRANSRAKPGDIRPFIDEALAAVREL